MSVVSTPPNLDPPADHILFIHGYQIDRLGVPSSLAEDILAEATRYFARYPRTIFIPLSGLDLPHNNPEVTIASVMAARLTTRCVPSRQVITQADIPATHVFMKPRDRFEEIVLANRLLYARDTRVDQHFDFMACDFDCARLLRMYRARGMRNAHPLPVCPRTYPGIRTRRCVAWFARMHQLMIDAQGTGVIAREIRRMRTWESGHPLII